MPAAARVGKKVWVRDPALADDQVFIKGTVISEDAGSGMVTVTTIDEATRAWPAKDVLDCTSVDEHVKDHCNLDVLNSATLVENTKQRFVQDDIYTYISQLLIAVNPFKQIEGLYTDKKKEIYRGCNWAQEEPHVYAIAEMSYQSMTMHNQSQSLLVSGESGAGKTETNKQLMDYLIWRSGTSGGGSTAGLAKRILDTNPVLEALGNAKSIRNNNSSRFGKYVNLKFDKNWKVMGAEVRTFLLEKSRVTNASLAKERSYHIFYQILAGSQNGDKGLPFFKGKHPDNFTYTSLSGTNYVPQIDDVGDFEDMDGALDSCGLASTEKVELYGIFAALMCLGDVKFGAIAEGSDTIAVKGETMESLEQAEKLLGIGDISTLLIEKIVKSPRSNNEYHIALDLTAAMLQRDALVKHIYMMIFDVIVARINTKIQPDKDFHRFIGLLDVFGFEVFQSNSFEQLCINYANERLHNFFLMRVFEVEIELYKMQNLQVPVLTYPDNSKVIELLEKNPTGIFPMLDAQCKMPKGSDKNFNMAICKTHTAHPHFSTLANAKIKMHGVSDDEVFVIHHFAGDVVYSSKSFLDKNTDALSQQFEGQLKKSSVQLIVQCVTGVAAPEKKDKKPGDTPRGGKAPQDSARGGKKAPKDSARGGKAPASQTGSVSKKFLLGLKQLMREIATTHPFFIRCIKPNQKLIPIELNTSMVLSQMERSGTIECVKLMQAGYPSRAPYADLQTRFKSALPPFMLGLEAHQFVELLLLATNCQPGEYQLGQDMVFFRANKGGVLQELMMMRKDKVAEAIANNAKGNASVSTPSEYIAMLDAFVEERKDARAKARKEFEGAIAAMLRMQLWVKWGEKQIGARNAAAVKIEAMRRGRAARVQAEQLRKAADEKAKAELAAKKAAEEAELARVAAEKAEAAERARLEEEARVAAEAAEAARKESDAKAAAELKAAKEAKEAQEQAEAAAKAAAAEAKAADELAKQQKADKLKEEMAEYTEEHEEDETHDKWFAKVKRPNGSEWEVHRFLMCKGVEWGFQYHNFYGDWELSANDPLNNGRPHYVHNTMYGGHAHLFHTIDPHYHVPRWVIGPAPGNENGWAFCESDAPTPHEVQATWISWDGFEWHSCKSFRYVPKEDEMDGLDSDDDFVDEDDGWDDGEQYNSLSNMLAEEEEREEKVAQKVTMTLDEYEEMKTNRQNKLEEMSARGNQKAEPMEAIADEGNLPMDSIAEADDTPPASSAAPDGGKKKKKKGAKEDGESDRATKKGGKLFGKKK